MNLHKLVISGNYKKSIVSWCVLKRVVLVKLYVFSMFYDALNFGRLHRTSTGNTCPRDSLARGRGAALKAGCGLNGGGGFECCGPAGKAFGTSAGGWAGGRGVPAWSG